MKDFLVNSLLEMNSFNELVEAIKSKTTPIFNYGLNTQALGHIIYGLDKTLKKPMLIITKDEKEANYIYKDLKGLIIDKENIEYYPKKDVMYYNVDAVSIDTKVQRLKVLSRLVNDENIIVVSSYEALIDKIITKEDFKDNIINIDTDNEINLEVLLKKLSISGYERVEQLEGIGQFSIRGGIVDVYSPNSDNPVRIELFGDEVDTIREFDLITQRSIKNINSIQITPVKEVFISDDIKDIIIENIKEEITDYNNTRVKEKFNEYIELLNENSHIKNEDMVIPFIPNEKIDSIIDYFKKDSLIFINDPKRIKENIEKDEENEILKFKDLLEAGEITKSHVDIKHKYIDILDKIKNHNTVYNIGILTSDFFIKPKKIISFSMKSTISYQNKLELLIEDLNHYKKQNYKVIILSGSESRALRLQETLLDYDLESIYSKDRSEELKKGKIYITIGSIQDGIEYSDNKIVIISDKQLFSSPAKKKPRKKSKLGEKIVNIADLEIGSFVVHEDHGIGRYEGIEQLEIQGVKKDYLSIRYKDEDKLYIPVDQMNLIQKYIGSDARSPKVNKLNSGDWQKTKVKAKKAVEDMAKELIELYAKRETYKGYAFQKDTPWQQEFEDQFPYKETDGQLQAIEEIKKDMESTKPMDRLLCGDVGYGKTEVALRAAFKAVMDGKQVVFLVPTTILASQHYETMVERFKDFPIKADMISRFRTPHQQKLILEALKRGSIDIVVGTHRLLSSDVKFKDLGLLIIDEEQRFGVKDKEKIKQIKENVDVLILTATPIPRTLHMSLAGIRDMSVLEEPPAERFPIQTYVVEYNDHMIKDAILKEISRGGQVYFVYNRVATIDRMANKLKKMLPDVEFGVAHGQMSERQLEKEMIAFSEKEIDCLVCTTIIETGLDIPSVNTIIIYNADKMGLSQLYQLRGRVGRSNRLAYGYFTYEKDRVLTEVAEKRLKAIKEFTEFGSGFKIAMRDLEIRGAGNLLGLQQHGHIEAIGYDLYVKFLSEAVRRLKGDTIKEEVNTTIDLNIDGYIPDNYIKDSTLKIEMYKKIAIIDSEEYYMDLIDELIDRFGDMPKAVENLIDISYIKYLAGEKNITNISQTKKGIRFDLLLKNRLDPEKINDLSLEYPQLVEFDFSMKPNILYKEKQMNLQKIKEFLIVLQS